MISPQSAWSKCSPPCSSYDAVEDPWSTNSPSSSSALLLPPPPPFRHTQQRQHNDSTCSVATTLFRSCSSNTVYRSQSSLASPLSFIFDFALDANKHDQYQGCEHLATPSSPLSQLDSFLPESSSSSSSTSNRRYSTHRTHHDGDDDNDDNAQEALSWLNRAHSTFSEGQDSLADTTYGYNSSSFTEDGAPSTTLTSPCRSEWGLAEYDDQHTQPGFDSKGKAKSSLATCSTQSDRGNERNTKRKRKNEDSASHATFCSLPSTPSREKRLKARTECTSDATLHLAHNLPRYCTIPPDTILLAMSIDELERDGWHSQWPHHGVRTASSFSKATTKAKRISRQAAHAKKGKTESTDFAPSKGKEVRHCRTTNTQRADETNDKGGSSDCANEERQFYEIKSQIQSIPESSDPTRFQSNGRCLIACDACKRRKMRCTNEFPACANCLRRGATCNYAKKVRTRGRAKAMLRDGESIEKDNLSEEGFRSGTFQVCSPSSSVS